MYIYDFGKITKVTCLMLLFLFVMGGCSENKSNQPQNQKHVEEAGKLDKEYDLAITQAENSNPEGFLKLYKIASESISAETSEIARDKLHHLLYTKTDLWIKTFSEIDSERFRKYLKSGGLAVLELPKGVESEEKYEKEIMNKLRNIKGNAKEMELVNYILQLYGKK